MRYRNILSAVVLLAFCAWYAYLTNGLPERSLPNTPGPSFFPWIITALLATLSVSLLIKGLVGGGGTDLLTQNGRPMRMTLAFLGVFFVYALVLPWAGFILASIPFFFVMMILFGQRSIPWLAGVSIGVPIVLVLIFQYVFEVQLPEGVLEGLLTAVL